MFDRQVRSILKTSPALPAAQARAEAARFVADPDVYAPHLTGGAVDVALVGRDGRLLDMGNLFEYADTAHTFSSGVLDLIALMAVAIRASPGGASRGGCADRT